MNLPFPLFPRTKQEMYYFTYGGLVVAIVAMLSIVNLVWNINTGMEARIMDTLQNATINVNYAFGGGC